MVNESRDATSRGPDATADPDLAWAKATGYVHFAGRQWEWLPFLVRLKREVSAERFLESMASMEKEGLVRIAQAYRDVLARKKVLRGLTVQIREDAFIDVTGRKAWLASVERMEFSVPLPRPVTTVPFPSLEKKTAGGSAVAPRRFVVAIIDDSIGFAHRRFRKANGDTRFEAVWQQDGLGPPPSLGYGALMTRSGINALLTQASSEGLDESQIYVRAGVEDYRTVVHKPLGRRRAHGVHVADLACGFEPGTGPDSEILIGVQLDQAAVQLMHPCSLSTYIKDALTFIVEQTERIESATGETLPIVVNISFGWYTGPHDGTSLLELEIDDIVKDRRNTAEMCVVLPAGNSREERTHSRFRLRRTGLAGGTRQLQWRLQPDDRTFSRLELWPGKSTDKVQLKLTAPNGALLITVDPDTSGPISHNGVTIGWFRYGPLVSGGAKRIAINLAPTAPPESLDTAVATAPAGLWSITVANTGPKNCIVDAWIGRDGRLAGWPIVGRQSYFEDRRYARFRPNGRPVQFDPDGRSPIRRTRTLNGVATGAETIVIGGFRASDLASSPYSSLGPIRAQGAGGRGLDPDAAARSDDSVVLHGVLAAGSRSGSVVAMDGTSVAAPHITRWLANQLLNGANVLRRVQVRAEAKKQEAPPRPKPGQVPVPGDDAVGDGRLEVDLSTLTWGRPTVRWRRHA